MKEDPLVEALREFRPSEQQWRHIRSAASEEGVVSAALAAAARRALLVSVGALGRSAVYDALRVRLRGREDVEVLGAEPVVHVFAIASAEGAWYRVKKKKNRVDARAQGVERLAALRYVLAAVELVAYEDARLAKSVATIAGSVEEPHALRRPALLSACRAARINLEAFERVGASRVLAGAALEATMGASVAERCVLTLLHVACEPGGAAEARRARIDAVLTLLSPFTDIFPKAKLSRKEGERKSAAGRLDPEAPLQERRRDVEVAEKWGASRRCVVTLLRSARGVTLLATEHYGLNSLGRMLGDKYVDPRLQAALLETFSEVIDPLCVFQEQATAYLTTVLGPSDPADLDLDFGTREPAVKFGIRTDPPADELWALWGAKSENEYEHGEEEETLRLEPTWRPRRVRETDEPCATREKSALSASIAYLCAALWHREVLVCLGNLAVMGDRPAVSEHAAVLWIRLARLCRYSLPKQTFDEWLLREPPRLEERADETKDCWAQRRCEIITNALADDSDRAATRRPYHDGDVDGEASLRLLQCADRLAPDESTEGVGDLRPRNSHKSSSSSSSSKMCADALHAAALSRVALRPWRDPLDAERDAIAEAIAFQGPRVLPENLAPPLVATAGRRDDTKYEMDPLGTIKRSLETTLARHLEVDEKKFGAILDQSKVPSSKRWRDWDWAKINEAIDVLRRGSSLDNNELRVCKPRLAEALRSKFVRRLGGFFRCDNDEPEKASFANLAWTPPRLYLVRLAGRLYTTLLADDDARASFIDKDRRGSLLQSIAFELERLVADDETSDSLSSHNRPASNIRKRRSLKDLAVARLSSRGRSKTDGDRRDDDDDDDASFGANNNNNNNNPARPLVFDLDAVCRGLAREFVGFLFRAMRTEQGARLVPPAPFLQRVQPVGSRADLAHVARLVVSELPVNDDVLRSPQHQTPLDGVPVFPKTRSPANSSAVAAADDSPASANNKKAPGAFSKMFKRRGSRSDIETGGESRGPRDGRDEFSRAAREVFESWIDAGSPSLRRFAVGVLRVHLLDLDVRFDSLDPIAGFWHVDVLARLLGAEPRGEDTTERSRRSLVQVVGGMAPSDCLHVDDADDAAEDELDDDERRIRLAALAVLDEAVAARPALLRAILRTRRRIVPPEFRDEPAARRLVLRMAGVSPSLAAAEHQHLSGGETLDDWIRHWVDVRCAEYGEEWAADRGRALATYRPAPPAFGFSVDPSVAAAMMRDDDDDDDESGDRRHDSNQVGVVPRRRRRSLTSEEKKKKKKKKKMKTAAAAADVDDESPLEVVVGVDGALACVAPVPVDARHTSQEAHRACQAASCRSRLLDGLAVKANGSAAGGVSGDDVKPKRAAKLLEIARSDLDLEGLARLPWCVEIKGVAAPLVYDAYLDLASELLPLYRGTSRVDDRHGRARLRAERLRDEIPEVDEWSPPLVLTAALLIGACRVNLVDGALHPDLFDRDDEDDNDDGGNPLFNSRLEVDATLVKLVRERFAEQQRQRGTVAVAKKGSAACWVFSVVDQRRLKLIAVEFALSLDARPAPPPFEPHLLGELARTELGVASLRREAIPAAVRAAVSADSTGRRGALLALGQIGGASDAAWRAVVEAGRPLVPRSEEESAELDELLIAPYVKFGVPARPPPAMRFVCRVYLDLATASEDFELRDVSLAGLALLCAQPSATPHTKIAAARDVVVDAIIDGDPDRLAAIEVVRHFGWDIPNPTTPFWQATPLAVLPNDVSHLFKAPLECASPADALDVDQLERDYAAWVKREAEREARHRSIEDLVIEDASALVSRISQKHTNDKSESLRAKFRETPGLATSKPLFTRVIGLLDVYSYDLDTRAFLIHLFDPLLHGDRALMLWGEKT